MDQELYREVFAAERKNIEVSLNENAGGKFVRIAEQSGPKRSTVVIPLVGVPKLVELLEQAMRI